LSSPNTYPTYYYKLIGSYFSQDPIVAYAGTYNIKLPTGSTSININIYTHLADYIGPNSYTTSFYRTNEITNITETFFVNPKVIISPFKIQSGNYNYYLPSGATWSATAYDIVTGKVLGTQSASGWSNITFSNLPLNDPIVFTLSTVYYSPGIYFKASNSQFSVQFTASSYSPKIIIANYQMYINLTAVVSPSSAGWVNSTDGHISTKSSMTYSYLIPGYYSPGANGGVIDNHNYPTVSLKEAPASGNNFAGWSTNNTNYQPNPANAVYYNFTLKTSLTVTATFSDLILWFKPSSPAGFPSGFTWAVDVYYDYWRIRRSGKLNRKLCITSLEIYSRGIIYGRKCKNYKVI